MNVYVTPGIKFAKVVETGDPAPNCQIADPPAIPSQTIPGPVYIAK